MCYRIVKLTTGLRKIDSVSKESEGFGYMPRQKRAGLGV